MFNNFILVSTSITSKITFYTGVKIIFLVVFSLFQIMMLTSIFGNVKVVSKISVQETTSLNSSFSQNSGASTPREDIFL